MPELNMAGSYELDKDTIDKKITNISSGNYALGKKNKKGGIIVKYVGRADVNLNKRLKEWVDEDHQYSHFKFSYADNVKDAFEEECRNYHDWETKDNDIHPARPKNKKYKCPYCDVFGED